MIQITPSIQLDERELVFDFVRASGPGGQNVNKVATAVQLRFDVRHSPALPEDVKERLLRLAGTRATAEGILIIEARRHRTQEQNRADAIARLAQLIEKAAFKPRNRHATRPTLASQARRIQSKKHRGQIKKTRRAANFED